jgi:hypothetical protein
MRRKRNGGIAMVKTGLLMMAFCLSLLCSCAISSATTTTGVVTRPRNTVTVNNIYVDCVPVYGSNDYYHEDGKFTINVDLMPGSLAEADIVYSVNLYESGRYRADALVSWTPAQLDASAVQTAKFSSAEQEYNDNFNKDLSSIFTIDIKVSTAVYLPAP